MKHCTLFIIDKNPHSQNKNIPVFSAPGGQGLLGYEQCKVMRRKSLEDGDWEDFACVLRDIFGDLNYEKLPSFEQDATFTVGIFGFDRNGQKHHWEFDTDCSWKKAKQIFDAMTKPFMEWEKGLQLLPQPEFEPFSTIITCGDTWGHMDYPRVHHCTESMFWYLHNTVQGLEVLDEKLPANLQKGSSYLTGKLSFALDKEIFERDLLKVLAMDCVDIDTALENADLRQAKSLKALIAFKSRALTVGAEPIIEKIGELVNLEYLDLSMTSMQLPKSLLQLQRLKFLRLFYFIGMTEVPEEIQHLTALESLVLSGNKDLQHLPDWLGDLPNLKEIMVDKGVKISTTLTERLRSKQVQIIWIHNTERH